MAEKTNMEMKRMKKKKKPRLLNFVELAAMRKMNVNMNEGPIRKLSAWAEQERSSPKSLYPMASLGRQPCHPPPSRRAKIPMETTVSSRPRREPRTGCFSLKSGVQCDACANIIAQGSILHCRDMTYPFYKGYPMKHYVNCPNCSAEMVIETVEGKSGFKSLVGATEYSGPVDERNKVIEGCQIGKPVMILLMK